MEMLMGLGSACLQGIGRNPELLVLHKLYKIE